MSAARIRSLSSFCARRCTHEAFASACMIGACPAAPTSSFPDIWQPSLFTGASGIATKVVGSPRPLRRGPSSGQKNLGPTLSVTERRRPRCWLQVGGSPSSGNAQSKYHRKMRPTSLLSGSCTSNPELCRPSDERARPLMYKLGALHLARCILSWPRSAISWRRCTSSNSIGQPAGCRPKKGPLHRCKIRGNLKVGKRLQAMIEPAGHCRHQLR
jgi:hypothetical protein